MSGFLPMLSTVTADDVANAVRTELAAELALIDVATSTRLATSDYTAPDNAGVAAIPTLAELKAAVLPVNITEVNNITIDGSGTTLDPWGPV